MIKFSATFPIMFTAKSSKSRNSVPKPIGARFMLQRRERREPVSYFCFWGAHQLTNEYEPVIYGIQQVKGIVDYETLYICKKQSFLKSSCELKKLC